MIPRERSFWVAQALVLYVCAAHLRAAPDSALAWGALAVAPLSLLVAFRLATAPALGVDWIDPVARRAGQVVATGVTVALAAEVAPPSAGFIAARVLGLALASTAAPVALARVAPLGGGGRDLPGRLDAAIATGAVWVVVLGLGGARALLGDAAVARLVVDYAVVAASLASIGIGMVAAFRLYVARRHDLGIPERAAGALWLGVVSAVLGALASLMEVAAPERIVPIAALLSAVSSAACAISQRPELVARVLRLAAAVTMLATPLMSVAVVAAYKVPTHAGAIVFVVTALAVAAGMLAPTLAERMAPEQGRWMRALERAIVAAKAPEPRQAVALALAAVRDGLGADAGPAMLHRFAARDRLVVDRAGYLHAETGEVPHALVDRVAREPERVASVEVLRALEVRDGEVRPWLPWLDDHEIGAVALVFDDEIPVGMLSWPAAGRVAPLAYEEVRALRTLADHLGVAAGAEARLDRSLEREREIERGMGRAAEELRAMRARAEREGGRQLAATEWLAARARVASYGPSVQLALNVAEHLGARGEPLAVLEQPGGEPLGWAAVVHLASARRHATMLVIDGARREEQDVGRWNDPARSPLELARGGTLVLLEAVALPRDVQRFIATAWRPDTGLVVVLPASSVGRRDAVVDPHLAALLGDRVVVPPRLADRAEDLRALALDELARLGARRGGQPLGLALDAQQLLVEHDWPGNEAELRSALLRAAERTEGEVVRGAALRSALLRVDEERTEDSGPVRIGTERAG